MATATKRVTSQSIRENAKRDNSPKWDGAVTWSVTEYRDHFYKALNFYRLDYTGKDFKTKVIEWMHTADYTKEQIQQFKKTKDWRCNNTMGSIACCLLRGMPAQRSDFNNGRSAIDWLKKAIEIVIEDGKYDVEEITEDKSTKAIVPTPNIQDRIREQAVQISEDIDYAIDSWITDAEAFDPKSFKMVNMLRGKGCKAAQARYIKGFFQRGYDELMELASGNADDQLREGYSTRPRKHIKKLIEFYESIMTACDQIAQEAKIMKKPRAKKAKPAEELVKKLKFKTVDDKLGIVSVPPAGIIGSQMAVFYNTKTRKIGYYVAKSSAGLSVKGTSIIDYTEKSFQKTLRKPDVQLKEFKEQNTQKRFETWFSKNIKTTETSCNGRMNEDIIVLKIYK
jgi:hypothetical protein